MIDRESIREDAIERFEHSIMAVAACTNDLGKSPMQREYTEWKSKQEESYPKAANISYVLGGWYNAKDLAEPEGVSREIVIDEVANLAERAGRIPTRKELSNYGMFPKIETVDKLFDSWGEVALAVAEKVEGVEWNPAKHKQNTREGENTEEKSGVQWTQFSRERE